MTVEAVRPRSPAMFPIVPTHLSRALAAPSGAGAMGAATAAGAEAKAEEVAEDTEPGACAASFIPCGAVSAPLAPDDLRAEPRCTSPLRLAVDASGLLAPAGGGGGGAGGGCAWVRRVALARDCPSAALRLELRGRQLAVRALRDLPPGASAQLWFSDALLPPLQLPFLAPANIRGEKQYVCGECGRAFEEPNPLKLHLALRCGRLPRTALWERLVAHALAQAPHASSPPPPPPAPFTFRLQPPAATAERASAFQPWTKSAPHKHAGASAGSSTPSGDLLRSLLSAQRLLSAAPRCPLLHLGAFGLPPLPPPHPAAPTAAPAPAPPATAFPTHPSEMETLASNLGTSKHGHLCIYCGKVYSRKYGLKIHIRTHTGYKPLKCKFCHRPFGDPSNLNKHIRLHAEGETPYKCEFCGKVLVRRRDLDRHIRSRHSLNPEEKDTSAFLCDMQDRSD